MLWRCKEDIMLSDSEDVSKMNEMKYKYFHSMEVVYIK